MDEVFTAKTKRGKAGCLLTIKGSKERLREAVEPEVEPNGEEENNTLQRLIQDLEQMLKEQREYSTTLREEYQQQTQRWGQTSKSNNV